MDFVSPIIESLKKQLGFLVNSREYVEDIQQKMDQLNATEKDIKEYGTESHRKRKWLEDFSSLNERSNLIEATGVFNVVKRYKVGRESYGILKEIEDLEHRESKIEFTYAPKPLAEVGSTSTGLSSSCNFKSRDLIFNNALQSLRFDDEFHKIIALCGMGGVGKTTMMEQIKKAVEDQKMYDWVVKVVIGENMDLISLQQAIAQYFGKDVSETTKDARAGRLRKIYEEMSQQGQKKVLVIMDDLWKEIDLKDVGLSPLPNGFKLLLTSRFEDVCSKMGVRTDSIFRVDVLNGTEATSLFFEIVGLSSSDGDVAELQRIGKDIAMRCRGLPIAIVTLAKSLRGAIKQAWEEALFNLQHHDLQDLDGIAHKVFEMSYNNLEKDDYKAIFILSGLFPDDFNIPIEDLMLYGWGLKLFTRVHTLAQARRRVNICVNKLIRANLLTRSDKMGCVKMHDLMRAFVLSNFSELKQASVVNHDSMSRHLLTKHMNDSYQRILLNYTDKDKSEFPTDFSYPNLSLLIILSVQFPFGNICLKLPDDIYESTKKLEVISYDHIDIPLLPRTLEHSTKLRTVRLHSCLLSDDDVSFLGCLCNLETLSLVNCNIRRLPSRIGNLRKLKLLDLAGCIDLHIDDGTFQNLDSLEELYMRASAGRPVMFSHANYDELGKLSQGLSALELEFFENNPRVKNVSFKTLERFRISIGCQLERLIYDNRYSFTNTIKFVGDYSEILECKINDMFDKTEKLSLEVTGINRLEDVSMHHSFSNLRVLYVSKCVDLTSLFTVAMTNGLTKLEWLSISECPVLTTLVGDNNGGGVIRFQKLNYMSLKGLPKMESLCDNVIELPEMVELHISGLPNFKSIYPESNSDNMFELQSLLNEKVVIPKLQILNISSMENLKQIWPRHSFTAEKNNASLLIQKIIVSECNGLVNLFPSNPLPLLNHLEEFDVRNCRAIEVLFNIDLESPDETWESSSSRLRSIRADGLEKLQEFWRIKGVNSSDVHINGFKHVETIDVRYCEGLTNLFTPTTINFDLTELARYNTFGSGVHSEEREINVTYPSYLLETCHHLQRLCLLNDKRVGKVVFDMDSQLLLLPHLQIMQLNELQEMSHVWKCNWNKFLYQPLQQFPFQNLTSTFLKSCPKIKYLFSPLMAIYLSNLKTVEKVL